MICFDEKLCLIFIYQLYFSQVVNFKKKRKVSRVWERFILTPKKSELAERNLPYYLWCTYLLSIGRRGFTNSPCRFLSKLRIMCLTVVLPQKKGSSKRLFSSCQTWMRSLDCPTHVHGVEDVHHDILQVVVEVSD